MKIYSDETLTRLLDDFCTLTGLRNADEVGFSNYAYFLRSFKKYTGVSARVYATQNAQNGE